MLLDWMSVGLLGDKEWYMVSVRWVGEDTTSPPTSELTKANSFHLPLDMRPASDAESHLFEWDVRVVEEVGTYPDGSPKVEAISPRSPARTFYWY